MSGPEYELGRRQLLQATGAGVLGATALTTVGTSPTDASAAATRTVEEAPDPDDYDEILDSMDGDGSDTDPYIITDVVELQAMNGDVTANYELGADIDASPTANWNDGRGFDPIFGGVEDEADDDLEDPPEDPDDDPPESPGDPPEESDIPQFAGTLVGRGYEITGLTIDRPEEPGAGLVLINQGLLIDFSITDAAVTSEIAGVAVGSNTGVIAEVNVEGDVTGSDDTGGLCGINGFRLFDCTADVDVTGEDNVGGLVGTNLGEVSEVTASGAVNGSTNVGGIAGQSSGKVEDASAHGDVSGETRVGGLVGDTNEEVLASISTGDVTGDLSVGGAVGESWGTIRGVTAEGEISGERRLGGLVGENYGDVVVCSALGDVTGEEEAGGLIGQNRTGGLLSDSFTVGAVEGDSDAGALVGVLGWEFMGDGERAEVRRTYWNSDDTVAEPFGRTESGDGEVTVEEESVVGLDYDQFLGESAPEHLSDLDFEQDWRAHPEGVPVPQVRAQSRFEILDVSPTEIRVSETEPFDIEAEVENTSEWEGTQTVGLFVDAEGFESPDETVDPEPFEAVEQTLDAGEQAQVSFEDLAVADIPPGTHTFFVRTDDDTVEGTLEVEGEGDDDDGESADDDDSAGADDQPEDDSDEADDDGPGFGVPGALAGIGAGAYLLARRFGRDSDTVE